MTAAEFKYLDEESRDIIIFEAEKIAEMKNMFSKFELFSFLDFFIETEISLVNNIRKTTLTYTYNNLPDYYAGSVSSSFTKGCVAT